LILVDLSSPDLLQYPYQLDITPDHILLSPQGDTLAIYDREQRVLEVQALRRNEVLLRIEDVDISGDMTFNSDGLALYWVDNETGSLRYSDLWSREHTLPLTNDPGGLSPLTRSVDGVLGFVSDGRSGKVYVINLSEMALQATLDLGGEPARPWGTANGRLMMVPNRANGHVTAISMLDLEIVFDTDAVPDPVAVNPGWGDTLLAVIGEHGEIAILDSDDGKVLERFKLEGTARAGTVTSDSRTLAVPLSGHGGLALFDLKSRTLVREIRGLPADVGKLSLAINNNLCH
jgi:DNA-binding beta-propeller fold protein YncE